MDLTLLVILGVLFALVGVGLYFSGGESLVERMQDYATPRRRQRAAPTEDMTLLGRIRSSFNKAVSLIKSERIYWRLTSANWQITVAEYILIRGGLTVIALVLGTMIKGILLGVLASIVVFMIPDILLQRSIHQRQKQFQDQLVDVLLMITGAVKIGYSLQQSLDVVISDMSPPSSDEFWRVRREIELGLPLDRALLNLAKRMENDDLNLVVTAININIRVGGNMTNMLHSVIETIRERIRLFNEVRVLTSYARYTGYLLTALPFITALLIFLINPDYMNQLLNPAVPRFFLLTPVVFVLAGNFWLRRLAQIKV